jgi:fatty acid desaturase
MRHQGKLFYPALMLEGVNLHVKSIGSLLGKGRVSGRATELTMIGLRLSIYVAAVFWVLPFGMAFAFLGVQLAVFGFYMGASFAPNHLGLPIIPRDAKLDFLRKQVLTSRNISGGWRASAFMGGLNYQIEHHLFPNMPRPHLARAREIVREYCETIDVPYHETTLMTAWITVQKYMTRVGSFATDTFACPLVGQFRRA